MKRGTQFTTALLVATFAVGCSKQGTTSKKTGDTNAAPAPVSQTSDFPVPKGTGEDDVVFTTTVDGPVSFADGESAFTAGKYDDFVRTVDIAPTLAALLGIKPSEKIDGVVLGKAIGR